MKELILWSYDASPFTQKALGLLALKGVEWSWVETPMLPPKDDLMELTGGYRGTPVLQIGADIYVDSQLIARELERRFPQPTLFPYGRGYELAMVKWSDAFFRSALRIALALIRLLIKATWELWVSGFLCPKVGPIVLESLMKN